MRKIIMSLLLGLLLLAGCSSGESNELQEEPYSQESFSLGTYIRIRVYDEDQEAALQPAFDRIDELEDKLTINDEAGDSEIDQINQQAGIEPVEVSEDVYSLLKEAANYSEESDGGFNYVIGSITQLWRIGYDDARKPEQSEIDEALKHVDYTKVEFSDEDQTVFLPEAGMMIDLGAIAKGYITDEVVATLKEQGVTSAIIDLGGNIYVMGENPNRDTQLWSVGVQDPNQARGVTIGTIETTNQTIVTSGIYERNLTVGDETFHHIFDSTTGYPYDNDIAGVSIITNQSIDGDALSTLIYSKGIKAGLEYIEKTADDGTEAVFVSKDGKVYISEGLVDEFKLNESSGYTLGDRDELK